METNLFIKLIKGVLLQKRCNLKNIFRITKNDKIPYIFKFL